MRSFSDARLQNFEHLFAFEKVSSPELNWKIIVIELPFAFLSFGCLGLGIFGFKSEQ